MAGIAIGHQLPGHDVWAWIGAILFGALSFTRLFTKKRSVLAPLFLWIALGYIAIQHWVFPSFPPHHIKACGNTFQENIVGTVVDDPLRTGLRLGFTVRVLSLGQQGSEATGLLKVSLWDDSADIRKGDILHFSAKITFIRGFKNPDGYDYERAMAYQKIWVACHIQKGKWGILSSLPMEMGRKPGNYRQRLKQFLTRPESGDADDVLRALIIGDRSGIHPRVQEQFNQAGISHLLAISGLHIGIIGTLFFGVFRWGLSRWNRPLWNGWVFKGSSGLCMIPVLAYGSISGLSPATQRALVMAVVVMAALWCGRRSDSLSILALAALGILVVSPPILFSVSFQLSFAAVLWIILGIKISPASWRLPTQPGIKTLRGFVMVSVFATFGTLPMVMYYFNQFSFTGILANLLFIPLIGFIVVPLGLLTVFAFLISEYAAEWILPLPLSILERSLAAVPFFSSLPFGGFKTFTPTGLEIAWYYAALSWALLLWQKKDRKSLMLGFWVLALWGVADAGYWVYERFGTRELRVTVMDVGQGSATLLEFPSGHTMLIDGGGFYDNALFDVGQRIVAPFLWRRKILTIDTVVLTHADSDHLNGLLYVLKHFHVGRILSTGVGKDTEAYREFVNTIQEKKISAPPFESIDRQFMVDTVHVAILFPMPDIRSKIPDTPAYNDFSVVIRVQMGAFSFLFPADIEASAESELAAAHGKSLASTVLLAPHHGCRTSSTEAFLERVNPAYIVISTGMNNRYHCPAPEVLGRYQNRGCEIFRTDLDGAVQIRTDGGKMRFSRHSRGWSSWVGASGQEIKFF